MTHAEKVIVCGEAKPCPAFGAARAGENSRLELLDNHSAVILIGLIVT
jgi:hypothetical protein